MAVLLMPGLAWSSVVERVAAVVNNEVIALSEIYEIGGEFIAETVASSEEEGVRRKGV